MKKKWLISAGIIIAAGLILWAAIFITDYCRSMNLKTPIFARASVLADDGGSGTYQGLGYRVAVEKYEDAGYGVLTEAVTMYIGNKVVAASITESNDNGIFVGEQQNEDWGITLSASAVTADGMTVVFHQSGGAPKGELQTGDWFVLERRSGDGWEKLSPLLAEEEYGFNSIAYGIPKEGSFELPVLWKWLYGSLEPGEYRMAKSVMDFIETGVYTQQQYYAEFTVE